MKRKAEAVNVGHRALVVESGQVHTKHLNN
jgi:hypothetical protein